MDELDFSFGKMDFDFFSESEYDIAKHGIKIVKPKKTKTVLCKYKFAEEMAREISLDENVRYYAIINGSFIFGDLIEALIIEKRLKVNHLLISTLSLSENNIDSLHGLLSQDYVTALSLIVSEHFYSHERGNLVKYAYEELGGYNFQLATCRTHQKLALIETTCKKYIVIHGSANLRSSGNIEQINIEENREIFDFEMEYNLRIIEEFQTIKKKINRGKLWHLVAKDSKE